MGNAAAKVVAAYIESKDFRWSYSNEEETTIRLGVKMDNINVEMFAHFDDDCESVSIMGRGMGNVPSNKFDRAYSLCNDMNNDYRWIKFYIDNRDGEIMTQIDAVIQLDSCGDEVWELFVRMAKIMDEAYNKIMEGLWAK